MNNLEFVTSEELFDELKRRFLACVFVGHDNRDFIQLWYGGFGVHCMGLARHAEKRLYELVSNPPPQPTPPDIETEEPSE